jgi:hypothetical protein
MNQQEELLALAEEYIGRGIPVFFLDLETKAPIEEGLKGFKGATLDPEQLVERMARLRLGPSVGLGLYPGPGGYVVLDVDDKNGKEGTNELLRLMERVGAGAFDTAAASTPSGGKHIWFKKDDAFVGNGDLCSGVNVRADAGYVVAPGQYKADGTGWEWLSGRLLEVAAPWPKWLEEQLNGFGKRTGGDKWRPVKWDDVSEEDRLLCEKFEELGFHTPTIQNEYLSLVAPHKRTGVGVSIGYIGAGVGLVWDDSCMVDGKTLPHGRHEKGMDVESSGVFSLEELEHWLSTGRKRAEIRLKGPQLVATPKTGRRSLRESLLDLDGLLDMEPPKYLIHKLLVQNSLAELFADPGVGKSFVAIDWMMHLAAGMDWQGYKVTEKVKTFYIAAEGAAGLGKRVQAWMQEHPDLDLVAPTVLKRPVNLAGASGLEDLEELFEILEEEQPGLVVVDTLARSAAGAEGNSDRDMGIVIEHATHIQQLTGATVLILHHSGHQNKERGRGSSSLDGAMDTIFRLAGNSPTAGLKLDVTKQKDDEEEKNISLKAYRVKLEGRRDLDGNCVTSLVFASEFQEIEVEEETDKIPPMVLKVVDALWKAQIKAIDNAASNSEWKSTASDLHGMAQGTFYANKKAAIDINELVVCLNPDETKVKHRFRALQDPYATHKRTVTVNEEEAKA